MLFAPHSRFALASSVSTATFIIYHIRGVKCKLYFLPTSLFRIRGLLRIRLFQTAFISGED
ncbi:hypothetical protein SD70_30105 [Gordoniibacillus kamchatkensis]|uniref:Uncharacterized protein n=1 Tax=Gordoniibacillus kamchatkensis TaxID=1590651 RepID=A0ABR5AA94_9BACL|nr:hypothetical protein SD70_30105 [Paenibacillus sp. VKM B-2647]